MSNYKIQFIGKDKKPISDEILVTADSVKQGIREACRIGKFDYPPTYKASVQKIDLSKSPLPPKKKGDEKLATKQN